MKTKKVAKQVIILLVSLVLTLALALLTVQIINATHKVDVLPSSDLSEPPASSVLAGADSQAEPLPPSSVPESVPVVDLPPRIAYSLPANGLIDDSYFDNVTFVGDSISQGLQIYSEGIPNAHHCTYKNIGPKGIYDGTLWARPDGVKEVPMDAIVASQPDNVYILIGTNAIVGMADDVFLAYYNEMLDVIRANLHPEVSIYIQGITPVVQGVDARFDMERINNLNDALAQMAVDKGCYYLNLAEVLAGEDGWLRPEYGAKDGYHLTPEGYGVWAQYLRTHTATNRRHRHLYIEEPTSEAEGDAA